MPTPAVNESVVVSVVILDRDGAVTHWNRGAEDILGWTREEVEGRTLIGWVLDPAEGDAHMRDVRRDGQAVGRFRARHRDGHHLTVRSHTTINRDAAGRAVGFTGVSVDISEQVRVQQELAAANDYLHTITESMGDGLFTTDEAGRLIYVNRAAERMLGCRREDLAGRPAEPIVGPVPQGGVVREEHGVYLRADGSPMSVAYTAAPFETADGNRGTVVVFEDTSEREERARELERRVAELSWVGRIRQGLAEDHFELHAQPIVDVRTGETVQHELLIRLREADGSLIAPGCFLPTAEEHGLIAEIDRWVARRAIALAAEGIAVELNLSAQSVGCPAVLEDFREALRETGADPSLIVVELTETALLADERGAFRFVEQVKSLGCRFALDDFGTGYGGFTYLKRLPVDYLKIDREFIRDLATNDASRHVVQAVVSLAQGFGQKTVAEGVEDAETFALLKRFGVDLAQGFWLGRPAPAASVFALAA